MDGTNDSYDSEDYPATWNETRQGQSVASPHVLMNESGDTTSSSRSNLDVSTDLSTRTNSTETSQDYDSDEREKSDELDPSILAHSIGQSVPGPSPDTSGGAHAGDDSDSLSSSWDFYGNSDSTPPALTPPPVPGPNASLSNGNRAPSPEILEATAEIPPEPVVNEPLQPPVVEEPQCRICYAGAEESDELGPLICPCRCTGTIRVSFIGPQGCLHRNFNLQLTMRHQHIHVQCLNSWRTRSPSRSAFWECPQCHFKYAFLRTRVIGLAESKRQ